MLLIKSFLISNINQLKNVQILRIQKGSSILELMPNENEGVISYPSFFIPWCNGYEGLNIDNSELIDVRFNESVWYSIDEAREALKNHSARITIEIRLRRSEEGRSPRLTKLEIGYHINGSIISAIHNVGLPILFGKPVTLQRIVENEADLIQGVNPVQIGRKSIKNLKDQLLIDFEYFPFVMATQGEFQGGEVPAIVIRLESQSNQRPLTTTYDLQTSEQSSIQIGYSYVCDLEFDISVIAQNTQDVSVILETLCQTIANGKLEILSFGLTFGMSISRKIVYDDPIRESDLASLPTGSFNLMIHNVPIGQQVKESDLITTISPVAHL
jgi:hypothetical protein